MNTTIASFFGWLLRASWQASILVLLVLVVQWALQKRLSSRWRSALWLLVLARLMLPSSLPTGFSIFNYARLGTVAVPVQRVVAPEATLATASPPTYEPVVQESTIAETPRTVEGFNLELGRPPAKAFASFAPASVITKGRVAMMAALLWLTGVLLLAGRVLGQNAIFLYHLRSARMITEPGILSLFERCRSLLEIRLAIRLQETNEVKSPALYGFFRPKLLLPVGMMENFSREELRFIFLHELAHVKRRDMAVHWLATSFQILHWFNPVFWFGFRRLAADRELACDELALSHAGERENRPYGETIVKLLEICAHPAALPGLLGILEDKAQMKRRISMIAAFKKHSRWSVWAFALLLVLGLVTLTDAQIETTIKPRAAMKSPKTITEDSTSWAISGSVIDAETKEPVPDFRVTPRYTDVDMAKWRLDLLHATNGTNGAYLIHLIKRLVEPVLILEADGYMPVALAPSPRDQTNFDFALHKNAGASGTVLRPDGQPAAGVMVVLFCDNDDAPQLSAKGELRGGVEYKTDVNGYFSFKPALGMQSVAAAGPDGFAGATIEALAVNPKLTLKAWAKITGMLQRPAGPSKGEEIDLTLADDSLPGPNQFFLRHQATTDDNGNFEFDHVPPAKLKINYRQKTGEHGGWRTIFLRAVTPPPGKNLAVKIEAPRLSLENEPFLKNSFAHKPVPEYGPSIKGLVLLPNGKPATDAEVALSVTGEFLQLGKGAFYRGLSTKQKGLLVKTGPDGAFSLPSEKTAKIIAVHESGFAEVAMDELKKSGQIHLQPWGRVEGTLRIGDHPGTNETVCLTCPDHLSFYSETFRSPTDDQGKFVFTFVPPGEQGIARMIPHADQPNAWSYAVNDYLMVKPGETTEVNLGGGGRAITGQAVMDDADGKIDWKNLNVSLFNERMQPPKSLKNYEEVNAWGKTPEGKAARRNYRTYTARILADGSFRLEDVASGKYTLSINLRQMEGDQPYGFKNIASLKMPVIVPEVPAGKPNEPIDLGRQKLKKDFKTKVGDQAALFEIKTLDGKELKLADYRGKYVLLNFSDSYDRSADTMSSLKTIQQDFATDDRFALIGMTIDHFKEAAKDYAKKQGINWPQGFLGNWTETSILADYGVFPEHNPFGIPAIFLIGPDGKILAQDLRGDAIRSSVEKALAKSN